MKGIKKYNKIPHSSIFENLQKVPIYKEIPTDHKVPKKTYTPADDKPSLYGHHIRFMFIVLAIILIILITFLMYVVR